MNLPRDMPGIIPEVLLNRQTPISCIIRRDIRGVVLRTIAGRIHNPIRRGIIQDVGEVAVGVEY